MPVSLLLIGVSMRCVLAILLAVLMLPAAASETDVYLFWRIGCPHCEREIEYLDRLVAAKPGVRLHKLEVSRNRANANAMVEIADRLGVEAGSVPLTVIGYRAWVGYLDDATTGRELAAHIPGIRIVVPATIEDARGMLWTALMDPDPVIMFENALLYNLEGELAADAGAVDIDRAAVRRSGSDVTLVTYGGSLGKALRAAEELARQGIAAEVIDLRTLRPLDMPTVIASVSKTRRMVVIDEGWKTGSLAAEIMAQVMEQAFYELDAPCARVCGAEVPIPYAKHMEDAAIPQVPAIVEAALRVIRHD